MKVWKTFWDVMYELPRMPFIVFIHYLFAALVIMAINGWSSLHIYIMYAFFLAAQFIHKPGEDKK